VIAEDSEVTREYLTAVLDEDPGLSVVGSAHNGEEAVELAERLRPDVILMDLRMPGVDGVGFAADAGAVRRNGDAPAVSGYGLTAMRQRVDEYGGTFSVESEPGRGTCVSVSVPAIPPGVADA